MNIISTECVVALTWVLKDTLGDVLDVLDVLDEPAEFLLGSGDLPAAVDQALQGHAPGATLELHLEPEEAFGDYDEQRVFLEPRSAFASGLEEGDTFSTNELPKLPSGDGMTEGLYTVTEIYPEHVVLDGNHPLAGIALRLSLKVKGVRQATAAELEAGTCGIAFFRLPEVDSGSNPQTTVSDLGRPHLH